MAAGYTFPASEDLMGGVVTGVFNVLCLFMLLLQGHGPADTMNYILLGSGVLATVGAMFLAPVDHRAALDLPGPASRAPINKN